MVKERMRSDEHKGQRRYARRGRREQRKMTRRSETRISIIITWKMYQMDILTITREIFDEVVG